MEPISATPDEAHAIVADVERHVAYLRIALAAPVEDGWTRCGDLFTDPDALRSSIESTQAGRGAPDLQVAASLWFQAYSFRVALPVVAPFALGLPGLRVEPAATHIRIARNRPAAVAVTDLSTIDRTAEQAAHELLSGHLSPMVEAITDSFTIGRRLLWGNAAAALATVLRALEGAPDADRSTVRARAGDLLAQAQPWLAGLGWFEVVAEGDQEGWYWTRTNCCLFDQCEGASRCDDCSLIPAGELEASRRSALSGAAS